ncbi:MAG TPA: helix-turn-helix transcriptional regulator [Motilibacteraceae bacterium]|nr:helix-turn-helix transcriptional regulator [Motilibacteraceae bacterium]
MSRGELAGFLRERRARLRPARTGDRPRRTPGLRREEVAQRAGMSVEYYTRLEQARGARPSQRIVESLSRALELDGPDRARLFALADAVPVPPRRVPREVRGHVVELLHRMPATAAIVTAATYDVVAANPLGAALLGHLDSEPNLARRYFLQDRHWSTDSDGFGEVAVARLRAAATRYPADPDLAGLLRELAAGSARFRQLWAAEPTRTPGHRTKTVDHPVAGRLQVTCDVLLVPEDDQQVVLVTAAPGSRDEEALRSLAVVGDATGGRAGVARAVVGYDESDGVSSRSRASASASGVPGSAV